MYLIIFFRIKIQFKKCFILPIQDDPPQKKRLAQFGNYWFSKMSSNRLPGRLIRRAK